MQISIHTKELDNGWVLDAEVPWFLGKNRVSGTKKIHEVYTNPTQVRERVMGLLEKLVGELKEGIPERVSKEDKP